jgi:bacterioferritin (cytochrome b1)
MDIDTVDDLNVLLRGELSAIATYKQATQRVLARHGQDPRFQDLAQILHDHEQAASQLVDLIQNLGGTAVHDTGTWGTWANTVMGAASLLGDKAALRALKEGEEAGVKDYRAAVRDHWTPELTELCTSIMSREEDHVRRLDRLIHAA